MSNLPVIKDEKSENSHDIIQLVSFELEGEDYGIDVLAVREIIRMPSITKMPNTPEYVDGTINLRGTVVPIISMRNRFGLIERERDRNTRILVMEVGKSLAGFVVDTVAEVIRIFTAEIQLPPSIVQGTVAQDCITGVINHAERLLIVLDWNNLFIEENKVTFEVSE